MEVEGGREGLESKNLFLSPVKQVMGRGHNAPNLACKQRAKDLRRV